MSPVWVAFLCGMAVVALPIALALFVAGRYAQRPRVEP